MLTSAREVSVLDAADNPEPTLVSVAAFQEVARDGNPGKIRGHSTVINRIID